MEVSIQLLWDETKEYAVEGIQAVKEKFPKLEFEKGRTQKSGKEDMINVGGDKEELENFLEHYYFRGLPNPHEATQICLSY